MPITPLTRGDLWDYQVASFLLINLRYAEATTILKETQDIYSKAIRISCLFAMNFSFQRTDIFTFKLL